MVLADPLTLLDSHGDPESLLLPPDGLTETESVSFVAEGLTVLGVSDSAAVAVAQLLDALAVTERTVVIVCVRVSSKLRVVVLVIPSVDVTLVDTLLDPLGLAVMLVVSEPLEFVLL